MIGKIFTGKSFRGCIGYCLEDKAQKEEETVVKNRAELFMYNQCFGNKNELIQQFNEVRKLNPKLSKPVLHISLSLAPEERLSKAALTDMVEECAKELGFENNQYIAIHHLDTDHQHVHLVANRVGYDGKTVKDSDNYQKIASYCRKMELKYELRQVLSPGRFLSKELRQIPRHDARKDQLKGAIKECLASSKNYNEFENKMKQKGYEVIKARGIAFRDKKKVYTKGSEVGYALATIEKILAIKPELKQTFLIQKEQQEQVNTKEENRRAKPTSLLLKSKEEKQKLSIYTTKEIKPETSEEKHRVDHFKILEQLIKPEQNLERINPELLKKKKRKKHNLHL
jgi:hypothetical protein